MLQIETQFAIDPVGICRYQALGTYMYIGKETPEGNFAQR